MNTDDLRRAYAQFTEVARRGPFATPHSVIEAAAGWDNLVDAVQKSGDELMALAGQMSDDQAAIRIPARIVSDGEVVLDANVPIGTLVRGPADVHLRLHTEQLAGLVR